MRGKKDCITASEIAQFHFCPVSWYLRKQGFLPASTLLKKGKKIHHRVGYHLFKSAKIERRIIRLRFLGLVLLFISILVFILAVIY